MTLCDVYCDVPGISLCRSIGHVCYYWARLSKISWFVSGEQINNIIICQSQWLRQIFDLWDNNKSLHFAITKFLLFYRLMTEFVYQNSQQLKDFLKAQKSHLHYYKRACFQLRMSRMLFAAKHLSAGHVVGSWPLKRKGKIHRKIIIIIGVCVYTHEFCVSSYRMTDLSCF